MAMNLLGLILIASLSLCIVAVSLRLRSPLRASYGRSDQEESPGLRWNERVSFARRRDAIIE
jgi:hypothetical protein